MKKTRQPKKKKKERQIRKKKEKKKKRQKIKQINLQMKQLMEMARRIKLMLKLRRKNLI